MPLYLTVIRSVGWSGSMTQIGTKQPSHIKGFTRTKETVWIVQLTLHDLATHACDSIPSPNGILHSCILTILSHSQEMQTNTYILIILALLRVLLKAGATLKSESCQVFTEVIVFFSSVREQSQLKFPGHTTDDLGYLERLRKVAKWKTFLSSSNVYPSFIQN